MLNRAWKIIYNTANKAIIEHDGIEHAGYLSFLGLLSSFPFMVFMVALAGFIGEGELGRHFITLLRDNLPSDVFNALLPRINEIIEGPSPGLLTVSMLAALWTASSAVEGYRTVLNHAYHVGTPPAYIWRRLLSVLQLLIFSFLVLVGMLLLVFAPIILEKVNAFLPGLALDPEMIGWDEWVRKGSALIIFMVIVLMYHVLPNIRQNWRAVLPGALFTLCGWMLVVEGFRFYLESFNQMNLIYGSLGGVIAALLFFYLLNIVFILGAELNFQLLDVLGTKVEEKEFTGEQDKDSPGDDE